MNEGGILLTVKDLMKITGSESYRGSAYLHKAVRDCLGKKGRKLTVKEYCEYEDLDFTYVWSVLREKKEKIKV